jgi:carbonic anhydrase
MRQSPVDIRTDQVAAYRGAPLLLRYESSELAVENTGHVVEVPIPDDVHDTLQIGGDRYALVQYHFHAPSEHAVNGRRAAVEAHLST